jgi:hypothetical protein
MDHATQMLLQQLLDGQTSPSLTRCVADLKTDTVERLVKITLKCRCAQLGEWLTAKCDPNHIHDGKSLQNSSSIRNGKRK